MLIKKSGESTRSPLRRKEGEGMKLEFRLVREIEHDWGSNIYRESIYDILLPCGQEGRLRTFDKLYSSSIDFLPCVYCEMDCRGFTEDEIWDLLYKFRDGDEVRKQWEEEVKERRDEDEDD
jgi:hypothetical protein